MNRKRTFWIYSVAVTLILASTAQAWFPGQRIFHRRRAEVQSQEYQGDIEAKPTASLTADKTEIKAGETVTLTWTTTNARKAVLATVYEDGEGGVETVELNGSMTVTPTKSTGYRLYAKSLFRKTHAQCAVDVIDGDTPAPDPEPPTPPEPVEGFTLSAVGIGSVFNLDDALSAASRNHELGALLTSQNGGWLQITDEVMAADHPKAFDKWVKVLADSSKSKPAIIWHNQGKVLAIDTVAGKSKDDLLQLALAQIPADDTKVTIRGQVRKLGLLPPKKGAKYSGPSVSAILKPLAAADCPSVDLISQCLYRKNQTGGTCVLNAFTTGCEAAIYLSYGKENTLQLSPYFLANLTDGYNGTWAATAAEMVQKYGNLPFGTMSPYDRLPAGWKNKAANYKCLAVYGPPDRNPQGYIRAALNRGYVVCAGVGVGSGFDPDSSGYISFSRGGSRSVNHEILIVGWDQAKKQYKILNSWGRNWGVDGTAWLEDRFFDYDNDLWVVVAMVANPSYKFYSPVDPKSPKGRKPELNPKITASATQVNPGDQVIVMWTNTTDTVLCTLNGQAVAINGQKEIYPEKDATYSIIAYDKKGNTQVSWVRVEVVAPKLEVQLPTEEAIQPPATCPTGGCPTGDCGGQWRPRRRR